MGGGEYRAMLSGSRDCGGFTMDTLTEIFPNLPAYIELLPVFVIGLCSGIVAFFGDKSEHHTKFYAIKCIVTSAFITIIMYSILAATDLPYLAKVGISCAIGYFGIDKAIEIVQKIIALKGARTTEQVDKPAENKDKK